ncbi:hypothetical protein GCM10010124_25150 [Pilimelia terevasa]|uniref:Uncharacterized protein n=2 Tax=Pilimelia terevasa TaxID=53372 RepID=A0A8J3BN95_9ACTN|nr:hypothetical protein GCM10010124_25150 [Pilimelia terevasa]
MTTATASTPTGSQKVIAAMWRDLNGGPATAAQVADAAGLGYSTVTPILRRMGTEGTATKDGQGRWVLNLDQPQLVLPAAGDDQPTHDASADDDPAGDHAETAAAAEASTTDMDADADPAGGTDPEPEVDAASRVQGAPDGEVADNQPATAPNTAAADGDGDGDGDAQELAAAPLQCTPKDQTPDPQPEEAEGDPAPSTTEAAPSDTAQTTDTAETTDTDTTDADTADEQKKGRRVSAHPKRPKGALRGDVLAVLQADPDTAFKVSQICKHLDTVNDGSRAKASAGAVANALDKLVGDGSARRHDGKPATYQAE